MNLPQLDLYLFHHQVLKGFQINKVNNLKFYFSNFFFRTVTASPITFSSTVGSIRLIQPIQFVSTPRPSPNPQSNSFISDPRPKTNSFNSILSSRNPSSPKPREVSPTFYNQINQSINIKVDLLIESISLSQKKTL